MALKARARNPGSELASVPSHFAYDLSCTVLRPPRRGGSNIVWTLRFSDGVKWVARIPGNGAAPFGSLESREFLTNIRTISFIRSATLLPVPEIFTWECAADNPIRVPYRLEAFVEGTLLSDAWIDPLWATENKRVKVVKNLAVVMSKLHPLVFDRIGVLHFDSYGNYSHVGEAVYMDQDWKKIMKGEQDYWGTAEIAPSSATNKEDLLGELQESMIPTEKAPYLKAVRAIIRLAIESIPDLLESNGTFALGHPDLNHQNVLINDNCEITGIIDWDGTWTGPRGLAFPSYPSWITRDWDPVKYRYGKMATDGCRPEDSPEQLLSYRRAYAAAFSELRLPASLYSNDHTKLSQIFEAITLTIRDEVDSLGILTKLLQWAFNDKLPFPLHHDPVRQDDEDDNDDGPCMSPVWSNALNEIGELYLEGKADHWMAAIKEAFATMWHPEWDD